MSDISAIYLRLPNWIGDVCMSLPCLDAVLACNLPVIVCARPWAKDLLNAYPLSGFIGMSSKLMQDRNSVLEHIKQSGYKKPHGLLLPDSLSSAVVFRLSGIHSAGYRDDGRSLLLRWPIDKPDKPLHAVESWYGLTRSALQRWHLLNNSSQTALTKSLNLQLTTQHYEQANLALTQANLTAHKFVLIAPTAVGLHKGKIKVWPYFHELTVSLQSMGHKVVMCPPPAEAEQARQNAPTAICLPPLSLGAFAALTQQAQLVICNDSGVSHIAAAANSRQLTLFGVTQKERTGPWSEAAICLGNNNEWPDLHSVLSNASKILAN